MRDEAAAILFPAYSRSLRVAAGYRTQEDLAAALAVHRNTVGAWERGETEPPYAAVLYLREKIETHALRSLLSRNQGGATWVK